MAQGKLTSASAGTLYEGLAAAAWRRGNSDKFLMPILVKDSSSWLLNSIDPIFFFEKTVADTRRPFLWELQLETFTYLTS